MIHCPCEIIRRRREPSVTFERTVLEIDGDYAVLISDTGEESRTALALLPDGLCEGMRLVFENFEYRIKEGV